MFLELLHQERYLELVPLLTDRNVKRILEIGAELETLQGNVLKLDVGVKLDSFRGGIILLHCDLDEVFDSQPGLEAAASEQSLLDLIIHDHSLVVFNVDVSIIFSPG